MSMFLKGVMSWLHLPSGGHGYVSWMTAMALPFTYSMPDCYGSPFHIFHVWLLWLYILHIYCLTGMALHFTYSMPDCYGSTFTYSMPDCYGSTFYIFHAWLLWLYLLHIPCLTGMALHFTYSLPDWYGSTFYIFICWLVWLYILHIPCLTAMALPFTYSLPDCYGYTFYIFLAWLLTYLWPIFIPNSHRISTTQLKTFSPIANIVVCQSFHHRHTWSMVRQRQSAGVMWPCGDKPVPVWPFKSGHLITHTTECWQKKCIGML